MRQDMLFPEEDAALLKAWIVKRIENTSDADSDVLAEYVIALLKHDGNHQDIRDLCEAEIPDFLTEEPKAFLDDVFHAIQSQSYKPRAPSLPSQSISQPPVDSFHPAAAVAADTTARTAPKKRALTDRGDAMHVSDIGRDEHRSFKQPRRGGWRGMDDIRDAKFRSFYPVPMPTMPSGLPHIDPETPIDTLISMQAMGFPLSSLQPPTHFFQSGKPTGRQAKWKGRCRDFDIKGYCSRGSTCMYDHGNESIFVPPTAVHQSQGYDSNETFMNILAASCQGPSSVRQTSIPRGRGGQKTRGFSHRNHKKGLAPSSVFADGPMHDRSKSTVAIENIPEESFNEEHVKSFFSQFGNISQVSLQPHRHLAIVKFDNWSSANDAYQSPKVIFDNRFVKVFWLQEDAEDVKKEGPDTISLLTSDNRASGSVFAGGVSAPSRSSETEVDLEEISRKQEDAQKLHLERQSRRQELERQRHELERQQQDLLAKHQAETEQLRARLAEKNSGTAASGLLGTEMLKAQLAALEGEAKMLGLDPNAAEDISVPSFKGRGYRGKQLYRGKQSLSSRGRNSSSWDQGARHAVYAQYSIDNRPKKLAIHGVDFTPSDKDEALRHFLLNLGEFESVETSPTVTHVSFQDRKTAEKFFYSLHGQELAGVDGKLNLSWVDSAATPATALADVATQSTSPSHDATSFNNHDRHHHENHHIHGGDNDSRRSSREGPVAPETWRQVDMDYEIGDDDAWGDGIE